MKKNLFLILTIILTVGVLAGCGKKADTKATDSKSTQTTVKDMESELKKEIQPVLLGFADTELTFDYTKYTLDDYKKVKNFLTESTGKNLPDVRFQDQLNRVKEAQGIAKVSGVTIDTLEPLDEKDTYKVTFTAKQDITKYIENGKDYSNSVDNVKCEVVMVKENGKFLIRSYSIK